MRPALLLVLPLLLLLPVCSRAEEGQSLNTAEYYPLEIRNLWEYYAHHDGKQEPWDFDATEPYSEYDQSLIRLTTSSKYRPQTDWTNVKMTDEGLLLYGDHDGAFDSPVMLVPSPLKLGSKWEKAVKREKSGETLEFTGEVAAEMEKMTIHETLDEAEELEVVRVTFTKKSPNVEVKTIYWLAKGVGPVKIDVRRGDDLVEYKISNFTNAKRRAEQEKALQDYLNEDN